MGTNFSQESTTTIARSIITLGGIAARFDSQSSLPYESSSHTSRSDSNDLKRVVKVVQQCKILKVIKDRSHTNYSKISCDSLRSLDRVGMCAWMKKKTIENEVYKNTGR